MRTLAIAASSALFLSSCATSVLTVGRYDAAAAVDWKSADNRLYRIADLPKAHRLLISSRSDVSEQKAEADAKDWLASRNRFCIVKSSTGVGGNQFEIVYTCI